jgi:hypothetical protein
MKIETKTRLVVLWTIVSVIALLFLTGCDGGESKAPQYVARVEATSGICLVIHNGEIVGTFDTPLEYPIDRAGLNTVIVTAEEGHIVYVEIMRDGKAIDSYWGSVVWYTIEL